MVSNWLYGLLHLSRLSAAVDERPPVEFADRGEGRVVLHRKNKRQSRVLAVLGDEGDAVADGIVGSLVDGRAAIEEDPPPVRTVDAEQAFQELAPPGADQAVDPEDFLFVQDKGDRFMLAALLEILYLEQRFG
jgi:hypothetical protein